MKKMKHSGKKVLSVFLAVLMIMTAWVFVAPTEAEATKGLTDSTYRSNTDKYGTPYWTPTTSNTRWMQWGSNRNANTAHAYITVPKTIYLDKSETLQSAGYKISLEWSWGDANSYRWGLGPAAWGNGNGINGQSGPEQFTMNTMFNNYSCDVSWHANAANEYGKDGYNDSDSYDVRNGDTFNSSTGFIVFRNPGAKQNYYNEIYLMGTPTDTGTGRYSTTEINPNPFNFDQQWSNSIINKGWKNNNKNGFGKNKPSSVSEQLYGWNEVWWDVVIYDKSSLNSVIDDANTKLTETGKYTAASLSNLSSVLNANKGVLTTRETTQDNIDTAKNNIQTAINNLVLKTFTITWKDGDGNVIETDNNVTYGITPTYNGATPTKTATAEYTYTFNNTWSPAIAAATANTTYTAQFTGTKNKYTVTWNNHDGSNLEIDTNQTYGTTPTYDGETPTKDYDDTYHYVFEGEWNPTVSSVTGAATYTAQFKAVEHTYGETGTPNGDADHTLTCTVCGDTKVEAHSGLTEVVTSTKEPTCTEVGYTYFNKICDKCGFKYGEGQHEIPALNHKDTLVQVPAKAPTCTEIGWNAYEYCTACDYTTYVEIPEKGHTPNADATCTDPSTCTVCGIELEAAKGHTPGAEPNCTDPQTCLVCHIVLKPALGHAYTSVETPPTCETKGYTTYTCSRCGDTYVADYVDATGHDWKETDRKEATCTEDGYVNYECKNDASHTKSDILESPGHKEAEPVNEKVVAATCTTGGSYESVVYCSVCGVELSRTPVTVDPLGHTPGAAATCTTAQTCTVCQAVINPALGHIDENPKDNECDRCGTAMCTHEGYGTRIDNKKDATCTDPGYTGDTICLNCGAPVETGEVIPALGHTPGAVATCTTDQICTVCKVVLEYAFGHTEAEAVVENNVDPTCTEDGSYDSVVYCSVCGTELSRTPVTVDALGHKEAAAVIENNVAPTCTTSGSYDTVVYCSVCGIQLSRVTTTVDALGHTFDATVEAKDATCLADGNHAYKQCKTCDLYFAADAETDSTDGKADNSSFIIKKLDHSYTGAIRNDKDNDVNGTHSYQCVNGCNQYGGAVNHVWDKGEVRLEVTCTSDGEVEHTCTVEGCGATYIETVPAIKHNRMIYTPANTASNPCVGKSNVEYWSCPDCDKVFKSYDAETDTYSDEVTDKTDDDKNGIPDVLESQGTGHQFTSGEYKSISGGVNGQHTQKCAVCDEYGAPEAHNYTESETDATCTETGKKTYTCGECGASYSEEIAKIPHTLEEVEAKPADCKNPGNNAYYECSVCSACFKDEAGTKKTTAKDEEVAALGHTFYPGNSDEKHPESDACVTPATCMAAAVYRVTCDRCLLASADGTYVYGDPDLVNGHKFDGEIQKNENGTHSYKCTIEGCPEYGSPTDCVYKVVADVASTCKTFGYTTYTCVDCGHGYSDTKALDPNNHTGEGTKIVGQLDAKCNANGYTGDKHCLGCGTMIEKGEAIEADPTVHPHGNMKDYDAKASTCQTEGYKAYRYCDQCGTYEIEKVTVPVRAHLFTKYTTNKNGTHTATCDTCDDTVATPVTDTKDCSGGTANCVDRAVCAVCKTAYGEVDENNHKTVVTKAKVDSTCQKTGTEAYRYCEACDTALETPVTIEKKAHSYSAWTKVDGKDEHTRYCTTCDSDVAAVATQTENCTGGTANCVDKAKCVTCKGEYGLTNPAVHKTEANTLKDVVAATCQKKGFSGNYYYDCCGVLKEAGKEIAQLAHSYTIEVTRVPATCTATGTVTYKCSTCVETEDVKAATTTKTLSFDPENHASTDTTTVGYKAPSCMVDGYTGDKYYTCCYDETKTAEENKKALAEKGSVIKANGGTHLDITEYKAVPSTCQTTGKYAYSYCSACGTYLMNGEHVTATQIIEPKKAHTFETYISNGNNTHTATCKTCVEDAENGLTKATDTKNCSGGTANCTDLAMCKTCNRTYGKLEPAIHKTVETIAKVDATCQTEGHEAYQHCDSCGKDITTKRVINKLAHTFGDWTKVENEDKHTRSCTTCDADVAAVATQTEDCSGGVATCKAKAECTVCGDEYGSVDLTNHISDKTVVTGEAEATCQTAGNTGNEYYVCCYDATEGADNTAALKKAGTVIPTLAHTYVEVEDSRVAATCLTKGSVSYKCSTCKEGEGLTVATKTEEIAIDKNNHASDKVKVIGKVDPTCATEGYTGDQYHECCYDGTKTEAENKNALIRKGVKTPATGEHNLINAVPEYLVEYIKDENEVITGYTAKEDNLTYEQKIKYRHADNNWYHVQTCKDCGEIVEDACFTYAHTSTCTSTDRCEICKGLCSLVNLQKHPEGKLIRIPEVPSTCDNQGTIEHYKCEACGKLFFDAAGQNLVEDMDDLLSEETVDHDINTDVPAKPNTDPNKPGTHVFECNDCDDPIVVDCSGGEATCKAKAKCSVCGQEYGEINEKNHESDEVVIVGEKAATCSEGGYTGNSYYKCCYVEGAEDNSKALKAMGEATPSEPSLHVKKLRNDGDKHTVYCEGCGKEFETVDHNWVAGEVPDTASCTEGYDLIYTCECTATKTESVPAKGHDYTETVTEKAATCTEAGSKTTVKTCKVCGNTETVSETIKALGHDVRTIKGVAPTCSTDGTTDYIYCNRCDIVIQNSTKLPATGCEDENHDGYCDDCGTYLRTNEDGTNCNCICHKKNVFMRILYKILNFFWKLFKIEKTCACGTVQHW